MVTAVTFVVITYVWFIIERIFNLSNAAYLDAVNQAKYPRMLSRVGLVSLYLLLQAWASSGLGLVFSNPYSGKQFGQRAMLTDISVSIIAILFLSWALG